MARYKPILEALRKAKTPIDAQELARRSGCHARSIPGIIYWIDTGKIKTTHTGRRVLYQINEVPKTKRKEVKQGAADVREELIQ